ncbi:hypothetical protein Asp14428_07830 [Actinoplanes sp. NBRC 14428]|uniref:Uncharacterized protein n=2 Tax=Pseudosporangium ferrugineum TaxID=439699 RepID=A0A2T0RK94_9ACTN|nr:hypothetical protein CLV70_11936 [Pseudosporangium ferrugineum]BCJ49308.1 hypothetical protein Asp14428_07830 [Actinoplanes sp. NBRC 14428]
MLAFLLITFMASLVVWASGLAVQEWRRGLQPPAAGEAEPAAAAAPPESLEGVLVRQVLDHEITPGQYRVAMHRLADRDADRHPLPDLPAG